MITPLAHPLTGNELNTIGDGLFAGLMTQSVRVHCGVHVRSLPVARILLSRASPVRTPGVPVLVPPKIRSAAEFGRLTPTERRVIEQFAAGRSDLDAAEALGMALKTLQGHLRHIGYKLGASSRPAKVHRALVSGQAKPPVVHQQVPDLTDGELRLLRAVARYSQDKDIAHSVDLALAEVNPQAVALMDKTGANSRAHLVGLGHAWHLFGPSHSRSGASLDTPASVGRHLP